MSTAKQTRLRPRIDSLAALVCVFIVGCTGPSPTDPCVEGGELDGGFECVESQNDGTPEDEAFGFDDAGPGSFASPEPDECSRFVEHTCGGFQLGVNCENTAACTAALLIAQYEPQECSASLDDDVRFPACRANSCEELVVRVCGALDDTALCTDRTECDLARRLLERQQGGENTTPDPDGLTACSAALEDGVVFPDCPIN